MKRILLSLLLCSFFLMAQAQKINFKKGKILVDKKEFLSFEKGGVFGAVEHELSELDSEKRIIILVQNNAGSHMDVTDDYVKIKFLTKGEYAEIHGGSLKNAIKLLLKNDVLRKDGSLDESKIELFVKNYNENISNRTIQIRG